MRYLIRTAWLAILLGSWSRARWVMAYEREERRQG